jgi:DNA-damage-inducible protein J
MTNFCHSGVAVGLSCPTFGETTSLPVTHWCKLELSSRLKIARPLCWRGLGLTVSDVVRILLTRIANEGSLPVELTVKREEYDAWFRTKVLAAMNDKGPGIPHVEVEAIFAAKRGELEEKLEK